MKSNYLIYALLLLFVSCSETISTDVNKSGSVKVNLQLLFEEGTTKSIGVPGSQQEVNTIQNVSVYAFDALNSTFIDKYEFTGALSPVIEMKAGAYVFYALTNRNTNNIPIPSNIAEFNAQVLTINLEESLSTSQNKFSMVGYTAPIKLENGDSERNISINVSRLVSRVELRYNFIRDSFPTYSELYVDSIYLTRVNSKSNLNLTNQNQLFLNNNGNMDGVLPYIPYFTTKVGSSSSFYAPVPFNPAQIGPNDTNTPSIYFYTYSHNAVNNSILKPFIGKTSWTSQERTTLLQNATCLHIAARYKEGIGFPFEQTYYNMIVNYSTSSNTVITSNDSKLSKNFIGNNIVYKIYATIQGKGKGTEDEESPKVTMTVVAQPWYSVLQVEEFK